MPQIHQINPPGAVVLAERKYPVVYEEPSFSQVFGNFRWDEYKLLLLSVAVGAPFGYCLGWKYNLTRPSAYMGIFMFGTAALAQCTQVSAARLMGILPNEREVQDHLVHKSGKVKE